MGRQLRFDPYGGMHHVMHRGSRRQRIFEGDDDRQRFLARLEEAVDRFGAEVHGYALMENHYHLLVRMPDAGLSAMMHQLNSSYARDFNLWHSYVGHLFQGRFRSILVGSDAYLVELIRYIHRNSTSAGIVARPIHDSWSSHRAYVGASPAPKWLMMNTILGYFGADPNRFAAFVEAPDSTRAREVHEALEIGRPAIGPNRFLDALPLPTADAETQASARLLRPVRLDPLLSLAEVLVRDQRPGCEAIDLVLAAARRRGCSISRLRDAFGFGSASTVRSRVHRLERRAASDPPLERVISRLSEAA